MFIDLIKAFDLVNREGVWQILSLDRSSLTLDAARSFLRRSCALSLAAAWTIATVCTVWRQ